MWDLDKAWDVVRSERATQWFQADVQEAAHTGRPALVEIEPLAHLWLREGEWVWQLADVFGVPDRVINMYYSSAPTPREAEGALWDEIFAPLARIFAEAFDLLKPDDIPGWFEVHPDAEDEQVILYYNEARFRPRGGPWRPE
jgi:hypothetical protein